MQAYSDAVLAYATTGIEDDLSRAYEIGREALQSGVSIAAIWGIHNDATRNISPQCPADLHRWRLEQFFLETVTVYDMAQNGYREAVSRMRDEISERKKVEEELRDVTFELARQRDELDAQVKKRTLEIQYALDELKEVNTRLRRANEEQAEFTYALSHDLKSPLNTIAMMLDILRQDIRDPSDDMQQALEGANATTHRMLGIIEDVLQYSKAIEEDTRLEEVDIGLLVEDIVSDLRSDIRKSGAKITFGYLPIVLGDAMQLRLLMQNLISNGIKFCSEDRPPEVFIRWDKTLADEEIRLSVLDNGIGIPEEHQSRIFGLFQRLHNRDEFPGTGLGLTLCKRIVGNHSGRITVDSTPGVGSIFRITLGSQCLGIRPAFAPGGLD